MKILHLYHDLMNLYGDYGNILALLKILDTNGEEYILEKKTLGDELSLNDYDFIYVGSGSEENQKVALSHLKEYKEDLKNYIESGKTALFTGNSFEMLGEKIESFLGDFEGLGIFSFTTLEQNKTRNTADAIFETEDQILVGFVNKCSKTSGVQTPLFSVKMGLSNDDTDKKEGIVYKNFYGTHLTGPVLVKNPRFLQFVAEKITGKSLNNDAFAYEKEGYRITLKKLEERNGAK